MPIFVRSTKRRVKAWRSPTVATSTWLEKAAGTACRERSRTSTARFPNNVLGTPLRPAYQLRLLSGRYHGRCPDAVFDIARVGLKIKRMLARHVRLVVCRSTHFTKK